MMRTIALTAFLATSLIAATPALAQSWNDATVNRNDTGSGITAIGGRTGDILATTPSRLNRSRSEMNRGRESIFPVRPTPSQIRTTAELALERGGFHCTIAELDMVGQLRDGTPLVEVACEEQGGVVVANSTPVRAMDCLDIADGRGSIEPCRIPQNVARVAAARQSASDSATN